MGSRGEGRRGEVEEEKRGGEGKKKGVGECGSGRENVGRQKGGADLEEEKGWEGGGDEHFINVQEVSLTP